MSFIGDQFSPAKGAGFQAQSSNVGDALGGGQLEESWGNTQNGMNQQQQFINALQAQGGIGNQSNVFAQQQALANQLGAQSRGEGPNPANAQLAQATGRNVEQQAALMGSQRGSSANAGLMARQASMRGGDIQQQAAGQAATMNAQQQLAAQQALQQQQSMMGGLATQQVGQQAGAISNYNQFAQNQYGANLNALAQRNAANVGMQQNVNTTMGGIAGINAQGQWQTTGGLMKGLSSAGGLTGGGGGAAAATGGMVYHDHVGNNPVMHNYADGGMAPNSFAAPVSAQALASANVGGGAGFSSSSFDSGMTSAVGDLGAQKKQSGAQVPQAGGPLNQPQKVEGPMNEGQTKPIAPAGATMYADGGEVDAPPQQAPQPEQSSIPQQQAAPLQESAPVQSQAVAPVESSKPESFAANALSGGNGSASVGGGAAFSSPSFDSGMGSAFQGLSGVGQMISGSGSSGGGGSGMGSMAMLAASRGGRIGGQANVKGDSLKNDTVAARLSPGEIVIPRSITQGPNAVDKSAQFVAAILAKNGRGKK